MRSRNLPARTALVVLACTSLSIPAFAQDSLWQKDLAAWRADHAAELLKPDGWLSLIDLEWLQPGNNSVGAAPDNKIHLGADPAHLAIVRLENDIVTLLPLS